MEESVTGSPSGVRVLRVLLVEDNEDLAELMALTLTLAGHEVDVAGDGPTAVAFAGARRFDVAVVDLGLPGFDGWEVARRLRAAPEHEGLLLVAASGYGTERDRARSREAGFDHHLVKPVDPDQLLGLLAARASVPPTP